ncbi:MAG TPA: phosphoribosyltransferase [Candidatus Saccharimonadales bacterium]|nr:phosphoribosyltransferase [Candidatus Saccharimonadales bacterium]
MATRTQQEHSDIYHELYERQCLALSGENDVPRCQWIGISGAHLDGYFCLDRATPDLVFLRKVSRRLITPFIGLGVQTVITPAIGTIPLGALVTEELMAADHTLVYSVWADKTASGEPDMTDFDFVRPGHTELVTNARVLIVDDIINRRYTVSRVRDRARGLGAHVVGVASVASLGDVSAENLNVPLLHNLCKIKYDSWAPAACTEQGPCSRLEPVVVNPGLGHGAEYQAKNPEYPGGFVLLAEAERSLRWVTSR